MRRKRLPAESRQVFREIRQELADATQANEVDRQNKLDTEMEVLTMGSLSLCDFQLEWDRLLDKMDAAGCLPDAKRLFRSYMGKLDTQIMEGIQNQNWVLQYQESSLECVSTIWQTNSNCRKKSE